MPWKVENAMDLRIEFVLRATKKDVPFSKLCEEFEISRPTGYLWLRRYREAGTVTGLAEKSRRPHHSPGKSPEWLEDLVVEYRTYYGWGAKKIRIMLQRDGYDLPEATINRIIKRNGLLSSAKPFTGKFKRFERSMCNELLQMDFKGEYSIAEGKCYPLSLIDDKSRYLVGLWALPGQKAEGVKACLESVFRDVGVPQALLMDHGTPWWSTTNGHGLTWLSIWMIKQGIRLIYSGIRHPQTQGKVERFHRSLAERTEHRGMPFDLAEWADWVVEFREEYNHLRPHEAIEMKTPGEVYKLENLRPYVENPPEWDYGDARTRTVNRRGFILYGKDDYFVCEALAGERVRIDDLDGKLLVTFRNTTVREIDIRTGRSNCVVLPAITRSL